MPKLETPEEFVSRVGLHDRGLHGMAYDEEVAAVSARDASIRAEYAALLKTCGEALEKVQSVKAIVQSIERSEDWSGGEPCLGTCRSFGRIKSISDEATTALAALREAGVLE